MSIDRLSDTNPGPELGRLASIKQVLKTNIPKPVLGLGIVGGALTIGGFVAAGGAIGHHSGTILKGISTAADKVSGAFSGAGAPIALMAGGAIGILYGLTQTAKSTNSRLNSQFKGVDDFLNQMTKGTITLDARQQQFEFKADATAEQRNAKAYTKFSVLGIGFGKVSQAQLLKKINAVDTNNVDSVFNGPHARFEAAKKVLNTDMRQAQRFKSAKACLSYIGGGAALGSGFSPVGTAIGAVSGLAAGLGHVMVSEHALRSKIADVSTIIGGLAREVKAEEIKVKKSLEDTVTKLSEGVNDTIIEISTLNIDTKQENFKSLLEKYNKKTDTALEKIIKACDSEIASIGQIASLPRDGKINDNSLIQLESFKENFQRLGQNANNKVERELHDALAQQIAKIKMPFELKKPTQNIITQRIDNLARFTLLLKDLKSDHVASAAKALQKAVESLDKATTAQNPNARVLNELRFKLFEIKQKNLPKSQQLIKPTAMDVKLHQIFKDNFANESFIAKVANPINNTKSEEFIGYIDTLQEAAQDKIEDLEQSVSDKSETTVDKYEQAGTSIKQLTESITKLKLLREKLHSREKLQHFLNDVSKYNKETKNLKTTDANMRDIKSRIQKQYKALELNLGTIEKSIDAVREELDLPKEIFRPTLESVFEQNPAGAYEGNPDGSTADKGAPGGSSPRNGGTNTTPPSNQYGVFAPKKLKDSTPPPSPFRH